MTKEQLEKLIEQEGDEFDFEVFGFPCYLLRQKSLGYWCGYVQVPKDSRLFRKNYYCSSKSELGISKLEQAINDISVHGGITFAGERKENDDTWYFGFDCGHAGDLVGYIFDYPQLSDSTDTYKTKEFVITECKNLARQLKEIIDLKL